MTCRTKTGEKCRQGVGTETRIRHATQGCTEAGQLWRATPTASLPAPRSTCTACCYWDLRRPAHRLYLLHQPLFFIGAAPPDHLHLHSATTDTARAAASGQRRACCRTRAGRRHNTNRRCQTLHCQRALSRHSRVQTHEAQRQPARGCQRVMCDGHSSGAQGCGERRPQQRPLACGKSRRRQR